MNRVLRTVITCLLFLAVPLQGYAAGGMLFCGASGGAIGSASAPHDHHHDDTAGGAEHHHDAAANAEHSDASSSLHDVMHGKCSACSSCCSAAALPSAPIASGAEAPRARPEIRSDHADPVRAPARLDRPPRLARA